MCEWWKRGRECGEIFHAFHLYRTCVMVEEENVVDVRVCVCVKLSSPDVVENLDFCVR